MSFLAIEAGDIFGTEMFATAGSYLVDQVGKTLLKSFDRGIFVVGPAGTLEKTQQQNAGATLFANTKADGAQHHPKSRLTFAFSFTVVDVQLSEAALTTVGCCHDSDGWSAIPCHGSIGRPRSLPTVAAFRPFRNAPFQRRRWRP